MKKKISLLLCLLAATLCFTGCASTDTEVEYDEAAVEQTTEFLIEYCNGADEDTIEQWKSMPEFSMELQLTQAGLPFTPESFQGALDSWTAGVEECGDYIEHGDYTYEASADELKVTTDAKFEDRDATISFVFDENLYLDSMTVDAKFSIGEILKKAGLNTVLGMGTVFAVLIFISLIISLFKFIPAIENAFKKKPKEEKPAEAPKETDPVKEIVIEEPVADDMELIAVISAAIAAAREESAAGQDGNVSLEGFVVRSIRRRPSNKWNS